MQTMRWFKWEPGLFPELERWSPDMVGAFLLVAQGYWRTGSIMSYDQYQTEYEGIGLPNWERMQPALVRLEEYLGSQMNSELSQKRSAAAKARWEKQAMQLQCKPDASAMQVAMQNQIQSQSQIQSQNNTPPPPPRGEPKEKKPKKEALFPIFESMDEDLKYYFRVAVEEYPTKDEGHNAKSASWETRRVQRDCQLLQAHWMALLGSGIATPKELAACALVACEDWASKRGEYQYIPNMSTFFGPEKSLWMSYLERARAYLAKEEEKQ